MAQTAILSQLPTVNGAAFDSHDDEHDPRCHPETRAALRQQIIDWAEARESESIFWLNVMAGTGKSTVSRTVAQTFSDKEILGASFFFKRGERDKVMQVDCSRFGFPACDKGTGRCSTYQQRC
jgi:hypothetical protein